MYLGTGIVAFLTGSFDVGQSFVVKHVQLPQKKMKLVTQLECLVLIRSKVKGLKVNNDQRQFSYQVVFVVCHSWSLSWRTRVPKPLRSVSSESTVKGTPNNWSASWRHSRSEVTFFTLRSF